MATLVSFHAHPDDEAILCGGVMRKAHDDGHRVVLVIATRGELGEVPADFLTDGEELWQRRVVEAKTAADILGVDRLEFLGYTDSGMMDEPTNDRPGTFWTADVDEAAARLAAILRDERADVLTVYDDHGGYGHPDHIQVHRVGMRAAELAGTRKVYQATINRDRALAGLRSFAEDSGIEGPTMPDDFGTQEADITCAVDVTAFVGYKRAAMAAHGSQISEQSFFLAMSEDAFRYAFGTEWFLRTGQGPGRTETDLMS